MNNRRKWLAVVWAALPMTVAVAADYPAKPVHIISPYTPGGGNDVICRAVAVRLGPIMGQPAVVENKPGANTIIGTDYVAKSPPDGYTMILVPSAHTVNPHLYEKLPYDSVRDFTPITQVGSAAAAGGQRVFADQIDPRPDSGRERQTQRDHLWHVGKRLRP